MHTTKFTVAGRRGLMFPLDMLRHDRCYPIEGLADMAASFTSCRPDEYNSTIKVTLQMQHPEKFYAVPTVERWASFGWTVTSVQTTPTDDRDAAGEDWREPYSGQ